VHSYSCLFSLPFHSLEYLDSCGPGLRGVAEGWGKVIAEAAAAAAAC